MQVEMLNCTEIAFINWLVLLARTGIYSFPVVPFCEAFVAASHRYSLSILPLRSREHKIKKTSLLNRYPSGLPICTMADAPELSVESNDSDFKESSRDVSVVQPLYITIGPPCSGKTTWIRKQSDTVAEEPTSPKIMDVCIDDQPGVYHGIPTAFFLPETVYSDNSSTQRHECLSNVIFGRSIKERMIHRNFVQYYSDSPILQQKMISERVQQFHRK
jgi:hypothetical protein